MTPEEDAKRDGLPREAVEPPVKPAAGYGDDVTFAVTPKQLALKRVCVLIDGFNLYHGMHDAFGRRFLWLDLRALAESLLKPGQRLTTTTYFTARVRNDAAGHARQSAYLGALRATGVRVVEGRFQEKPRRCLRCGSSWMSYEEKESDVNLCVSLMEAARKRECDVVLLITGDSDMAPAVRAARGMHPTLRIVTAFPPKRFSDELKRAVDASPHIGRDKISQAQLPGTVEANGKTYTRPPYWA